MFTTTYGDFMKSLIILSIILLSISVNTFAATKCSTEYKNLENSIQRSRIVDEQINNHAGSMISDWSDSVGEFRSVCGSGDVGAFRKRLYAYITTTSVNLKKSVDESRAQDSSIDDALISYKNCMSK